MAFLPDIRIVVSLIVAVVLEGAPFLLLGSLLGSILELYVSQERIARFVPSGTVKGVLFGLGAGFLLPTCECGVVPVVLRLLKKGVKPHVAITYMLAAPSINPIVLASTLVAFRGSVWFVVGRVLMSMVPAIVVGLILARMDPTKVLRKAPANDEALPMALAHEHGPDCAAGCGHEGHNHGSQSAIMAVLMHTSSEFLEMGKYLVLGATASALFKLLLPFDVFMLLENDPLLSVGAMMLLAVLFSVCSEADAFVAASFGTFPAAAKLSFISIGPMVDLKLMAMYGAVFHRRVVTLVLVMPTLIIFVLSVLLGRYLG